MLLTRKHHPEPPAVPVARSVANVMVADLTEALLAEMDRTPIAPLPSLPLGAPARAVGVLAGLHAADHTAAVDHRRYDPDRLLPRHATMRRVLPARVVLDDIDTFTADVARAFAARPELRHDTALLMALAPVVAMLKGLVA